MRRDVLPAILAGFLVMAAAAFATTTTTEGVLKSVDMASHQITLTDGTVISLPAGFKDPGLKAGEKVSVAWQMVGTTHQAASVTVLK